MLKKSVLFFVLLISAPIFSQTYKSGSEKFHKDFMTAIRFVSTDYVVFGKMIFTLEIDEKGNAKVITVEPKLKNSSKFLEDLNYALKKSNKNWIPKQIHGIPVSSNFKFTVNFNTEVYDHD